MKQQATVALIVLVVLVALFRDVSVVRNMTSQILSLQVQEKFNSSSVVTMKPKSFARLEEGTNNNSNDTIRNDLAGVNDAIDNNLISQKPGRLKSSDDASTVDHQHHKKPHNNETATTTTTAIIPGRPTTIVVKLSGEMGNFLSKFATARGLQLWARDKYGIATEFVIRHQDASKWVGATANVKRCFPRLRHFDYAQGNTPEYHRIKKQQQTLLGNSSALLLIETSHDDEDDIDETLSYLQTLLLLQRRLKNNSTCNHNNSNNNVNESDDSNNNITLPYVKADYLAMIDFWIDKYYEEYRQYFKFDRRKCCQLKPDPDESVFHFRNFLTEMPRKGKSLGFEELSPNKTAYQLFRNLKAGDKVAITTRFTEDASLQAYVDAFTERGIQVRVIDKQSPVADFCFLMHAKKELVGNVESSFVLWAGYLGNAHKVRLYSINSAMRRKSIFADRVFKYYNWTNPNLQAKVFFELYNAEEEKEKGKEAMS